MNDTVFNANQTALHNFRSQFVRLVRLVRPSQSALSPLLIHLNNAGQAPMCIPARNEIIQWANRFSEEGAHVFPALFEAFSSARTELSRLLGCLTHEVVFSQSAATAISQIALGIKLNAGDEIIVWDQEYPSNFYPWRLAAERAGARLLVAQSGKDLSTPLQTIEQLISPQTRIIATSWVQYRTGAMIDLQNLSSLARKNGIFTCVDIIQGVGCLPFDFASSGIDAACAASHKWMCASHSPGFFALREEHFDKISPLMAGAMTYGTPDNHGDMNALIKPGPSRFEPGGLPFIDVIALGAASRLIRETGISVIAQEAEWLARRLMHGLRERGYLISTPHGANFRGAIVNFTPGKNSPLTTLSAIEEKLSRNGVAFGKRAPGIRLSVHAHNMIDDIDTVLKLLGEG